MKRFSTLLISIFYLFSHSSSASQLEEILIGKWQAKTTTYSCETNQKVNELFKMPIFSTMSSFKSFDHNFSQSKVISSISNDDFNDPYSRSYRLIKKANETTKLEFYRERNPKIIQELISNDEDTSKYFQKTVYEVMYWDKDSLVLVQKMEMGEHMVQAFKGFSKEKFSPKEIMTFTICLKKYNEAPWKKIYSDQQMIGQLNLEVKKNIWFAWQCGPSISSGLFAGEALPAEEAESAPTQTSSSNELTNDNFQQTHYQLKIVSSFDQGKTWKEQKTMLKEPYEAVVGVVNCNKVFIIVTQKNIYRCNQNDTNLVPIKMPFTGEEWKKYTENGGEVKIFADEENVIVYANKKFYYSKGISENWTEIAKGILKKDAELLSITMSSNTMLFEIADSNEKGEVNTRIELSENLGSTWSTIKPPEPKKEEITDDMFVMPGATSFNPQLNNGSIYLKVDSKQIQSKDKGKTWQEIELPNCNQGKESNENPVSQIFGFGLGSSDFLYVNLAIGEVYSGDCGGVWVKNKHKNKWAEAKFGAFKGRMVQYFGMDSFVISAIGSDIVSFDLNSDW
jgi:hypothetical protein